MFVEIWQIALIVVASGACGYLIHAWILHAYIEEQKMWKKLAQSAVDSSPGIGLFAIEREIENLERKLRELKHEEQGLKLPRE